MATAGGTAVEANPSPVKNRATGSKSEPVLPEAAVIEPELRIRAESAAAGTDSARASITVHGNPPTGATPPSLVTTPGIAGAVTTPPEKVQGLSQTGYATAGPSTKNPPGAFTGLLAFQALAAASGQIVRRRSGPQPMYDPTQNVQSGHLVSGSLKVADAEEFLPASTWPDPIALVGGSRRPNVGMTWSQRRAPTHGTVMLNPDGTFVYSPNAELSRLGGTDSFTAVVIDRTGRANLVRITVVVRANSAPSAPTATTGAPDPRTGAVTGTISATDPEGDVLTYGGSGPTPKGSVTVDPLTGQFVYTPDPEARHAAAVEDATTADLTDVFTATVTDGQGGTTPVPVSVPVTPSNTSPVVSLVVGLPDRSTGLVSGSVTGSDADGDTLSYTANNGPALGEVVLDASTGSFTYTPTVAARSAVLAGTGAATDSFTVTVSDGHGGSVTQVVTVAIEPTNTPPTASFSVGSPNVSTGVVSGSVTGSDADGDTLSYAATSGPALGSLVLDAATGVFTYTPTASARHAASAPGGVTADSFTVTVSDGHGGSVTQVVTVAIEPANTAPTATVSAGTPDATTGVVTATVTGSDADADPLTYTVNADPTNGAVSPSLGTVTGPLSSGASTTFTYTPTDAARVAAGSGGPTTDTFTVRVSDGYGGFVDKIVTVTISPTSSTTVNTTATSASSPLSISTLGSFTDPSTGLTITRTDTQTSLSFSGSANWEFVTVVYDSDPGAAVVNQTATVYKTQGSNTDGVLTRVSNKQITVALPRTTAFDLQIKYNGQSTGYINIAAV